MIALQNEAHAHDDKEMMFQHTVNLKTLEIKYLIEEIL